MAYAAHWEQGSDPAGTETEQRYGERRTLRLEVDGVTAAGARAEVVVHNISEGGLLIETAAALAPAEELVIVLPEAGPTAATVRWTSGRLYGCEFAQAIPASALSAAQLRSVPAPVDPLPTAPLADAGFAARLQRVRKARGLTLAQIAARLGVSKPTVWAWEQGRSRPVESRVEPLLEALGVSRAELFPASPDAGEGDARIAHFREAIAAATGADPARVRIMIEL